MITEVNVRSRLIMRLIRSTT